MSNNDKNEVSHQISSRINKRLSRTPSTNTKDQTIFRIDDIVRETSKAAYRPKMVSIGPYYRDKKNLQKMENFKLEYLQGILERQNETSTNRYIESLLPYEEEARRCYAEDVELDREEFIEMMLLDGCFIIEFLRKYKKKNDCRDCDPIFKMESILEIIKRDLLLFENQIPFFILETLFDMTKISSSNNPKVAANADDDDLISLVANCLEDATTNSENKTQIKKAHHLLDLMYKIWCSPFLNGDKETKGNPCDQNDSNNNCPPEFLCINFGRNNREEDDEEDIVSIKSVTELQRDGIKFVKAPQSKSWLDIKFENGEIKISPLVIEDCTESILRNLIAYEQYMFDVGYSGKFVTDFTMFMDCLINTPMDVQKLRLEGIIKNWLGSDEEIFNMFNNIGKNIFVCTPDFSYRQHFKKVNEYCNDRRNPWMSDLKNTYFKSPWSITSLVAAAILLILTFIQTFSSFFNISTRM